MRSAVEWVRTQGLRALGLLGHSKAGSGVVLYAAKYDDVPRVVNVSGRFVMTSGALGPQLCSMRPQCTGKTRASRLSRHSWTFVVGAKVHCITNAQSVNSCPLLCRRKCRDGRV